MTENEINDSIAKLCGWTLKEVFESSFKDPSKQVSRGEKWHSPTGIQFKRPDYVNSLDEMYEAEKVLDTEHVAGCRDADERKEFYVSELEDIVWVEDRLSHLMVRATARQRAEALLKVYGFWK